MFAVCYLFDLMLFYGCPFCHATLCQCGCCHHKKSVCLAVYHIRDLCQNGIANHHATYARLYLIVPSFNASNKIRVRIGGAPNLWGQMKGDNQKQRFRDNSTSMVCQRQLSFLFTDIIVHGKRLFDKDLLCTCIMCMTGYLEDALQ